MSDRTADETVPEYDEEDEIDPDRTEPGTWTALVIGLAGVWLIVSPWVFGTEFGTAVGLNSVAIGALLALLGGYNYYRRAEDRLASIPVAILAALVGLWLLASPWVFELDVDAVVAWNYVLVGLLVTALGLYGSYVVKSHTAGATAGE